MEDRHRETARALLVSACGVSLDTVSVAMIEPWAEALAAAEERGRREHLGPRDERIEAMRQRARERVSRDPVGALANIATALAVGEIEEAYERGRREGAERMREAAARECSARAAREWADCGHPIENEQAHGAQVARTLCATVLALDPAEVLAKEST